MKLPALSVIAGMVFLNSAALRATEPLRVEEPAIKAYWERTANAGKAKPLVPREMFRADASGCVAVAYTIDADGRVLDPKVLRSYVTKKDGEELRERFAKS